MMIYTTIAVGRPPLRLYIVALVVHFIIHNKITNYITEESNNSTYIE